LKIIATSKFNPYSYVHLNNLIKKNREEYISFRGYDWYMEDNPLRKDIDESWRQAEIILNVLRNKKYKKYDIIVNTGQRNIVTNFNVSIEDKVKLRMKDGIDIIFQSWWTNPLYIPFVFESKYKGGPIKAKMMKEPFKQLATE